MEGDVSAQELLLIVKQPDMCSASYFCREGGERNRKDLEVLSITQRKGETMTGVGISALAEAAAELSQCWCSCQHGMGWLPAIRPCPQAGKHPGKAATAAVQTGCKAMGVSPAALREEQVGIFLVWSIVLLSSWFREAWIHRGPIQMNTQYMQNIQATWWHCTCPSLSDFGQADVTAWEAWDLLLAFSAPRVRDIIILYFYLMPFSLERIIFHQVKAQNKPHFTRQSLIQKKKKKGIQ